MPAPGQRVDLEIAWRPSALAGFGQRTAARTTNSGESWRLIRESRRVPFRFPSEAWAQPDRLGHQYMFACASLFAGRILRHYRVDLKLT
jgi:hypothetical protein